MSQQPPAPRPSLRERLRGLLARLRGGDVIVANVGQGASDVVVGKNIIKIGTLVVPALPAIAALLGLVAAVALGLWLRFVPAAMPPDRFNVAVAEFSEVDAAGRARVSANSALISKTLFTTIQGELGQLPDDYQALIWHDSMSFLQKRATIGAIPGATPKERSTAGCKRASDLGADIIVYGVLDASSSPAQLRLQFCARDTTRARDLGNLDELQKVDRLGGPLPVDLPLADVQSSVNPPLRVRTTLIAKLIVGLRYELASNPNFQANLHRALGVFTDARGFLEREDGAATSDNGGDLVYYFIGRENLLLYQDQDTPEADKPALLEQMRAAFGRSTELDPQFARAWTALAGAYYKQVQRIEKPKRLAGDEIPLAIAAYGSAITAAQDAKDRAAEAEARLALALTYWLQADAALYLAPPDYDAAEATLRRADEQLAASAPLIEPNQNRFHGFAAMVRGVVAYERAQITLRVGDKSAARALFQQTRDAFAECIAAGTNDPGDLFLKRQIIDGTCAPFEQAVAQALQNLQ
jgi:hypothetical protein